MPAVSSAVPRSVRCLDPSEMKGGFFSQDPEHIPDSLVDSLPIDDETFDFIVVGGGAAGCAAADILSQGLFFYCLLMNRR